MSTNFEKKPLSDIKVSIIVPCYNSEKYLPKCIESILNGTLREIEVIAVNDGSTDSTLNILRSFAENDIRVKIIDKPNSGYGNSMNIGFSAASGEYIGIVESDDFASFDMLEKLYNTAKKTDSDIVKSNFFLYYGETGEEEIYEIFKKDECGKVVVPRNFNDGEVFLKKPSVWSAIYRRKFILDNKISFHETPGASFQDTSFSFKVFLMAERAVYIYTPFIHYRQDTPGSSINSLDKKWHYIFEEYREIESFLNQTCNYKNFRKIANSALYDACMWALGRTGIVNQEKIINTLRAKTQSESTDGKTCFAFKKSEKFKYEEVKLLVSSPILFHIKKFVSEYISCENLKLDFLKECSEYFILLDSYGNFPWKAIHELPEDKQAFICGIIDNYEIFYYMRNSGDPKIRELKTIIKEIKNSVEFKKGDVIREKFKRIF